jgi:Type IV pilin-like G and H, putative
LFNDNRWLTFNMALMNVLGSTCMRFSLALLPIGLTSCQLLPTQTRTAPSPSPTSPTIPASRQAQAYIGAMNRSQQAVFLEKSEFAASLAELEMKLQPGAYTYSIKPQSSTPKSVLHLATTTQPGEPNFLGLVYVVTDANDETVTVSQICQTTELITPDIKFTPPSTQETDPIPCPPGFEVNP